MYNIWFQDKIMEWTCLKTRTTECVLNNIYTVGGKQDSGLTIAQLKKISLKNIKKRHSEVKFFDDDDANIDLAKELKTIKTQKAKV